MYDHVDAPVPAFTPSAKEQIVLVAERLFAERGIDGVSLRQIGAAAGNGNNSAVQYHFGSKDNLIQAIFEYRLDNLHERRRVLAAASVWRRASSYAAATRRSASSRASRAAASSAPA